MSLLHYKLFPSPVGPMLLCSSGKGLLFIEFNGASPEAMPAFRTWAEKRVGADCRYAEGGGWAEEAAGQLEEYFGGKRTSFDIPLDLRGTPFQLQVWQALARIPYGEVRSYKQIAEAIGSPKAVRAVGGANNRNPVSIIIPCHRVIGAGGDMVGYGGGLPIKQFLLSHEGYPILDTGVRS